MNRSVTGATGTNRELYMVNMHCESRQELASQRLHGGCGPPRSPRVPADRKQSALDPLIHRTCMLHRRLY